MEQTHLLNDLQSEMIHASTGKRFLNFVIDTIGYYAFGFLSGVFLVIVAPDSFVQKQQGNEALFEFGFLFAGYALYFFYYFLFEWVTGGRTLGKWITGTKAVQKDGAKIDFSTSFMRNIIRLIPFEIFSYFGSPCQPWHDRWADTLVIDIKKTDLSQF